MMKQMHTQSGKAINVYDRGEVFAPWGALYSIYEDNAGTFYTNAEEGNDHLMTLKATTKEAAEQEAVEILKEISEQIESDENKTTTTTRAEKVNA